MSDNLPPEVEEVRVLRVQPGDRLLVTLRDEVELDDPEELSNVHVAIGEQVASWAGVELRHVLLVSGASVEVVRGGDDA